MDKFCIILYMRIDDHEARHRKSIEAGLVDRWARGAPGVVGTAVWETGTDRTFGDPCRGASVRSRLQLAVAVPRRRMKGTAVGIEVLYGGGLLQGGS